MASNDRPDHAHRSRHKRLDRVLGLLAMSNKKRVDDYSLTLVYGIRTASRQPVPLSVLSL